jgi:hypothetical protein
MMSGLLRPLQEDLRLSVKNRSKAKKEGREDHMLHTLLLQMILLVNTFGIRVLNKPREALKGAAVAGLTKELCYPNNFTANNKNLGGNKNQKGRIIGYKI